MFFAASLDGNPGRPALSFVELLDRTKVSVGNRMKCR